MSCKHQGTAIGTGRQHTGSIIEGEGGIRDIVEELRVLSGSGFVTLNIDVDVQEGRRTSFYS